MGTWKKKSSWTSQVTNMPPSFFSLTAPMLSTEVATSLTITQCVGFGDWKVNTSLPWGIMCSHEKQVKPALAQGERKGKGLQGNERCTEQDTMESKKDLILEGLAAQPTPSPQPATLGI